MRILLLGKGYVGGALYDELSNCYLIDHVSKADVDYTQTNILHSYIASQVEPYCAIINTCGYTGSPNVDACEDNKYDTWYYNVTVPINIQQVAQMLNIPFLHISSGCIYNGYDKEYTEQDIPNFGMYSDDSSWYSKTKHACELSLQETSAYIFRIRMPFCGTWNRKNILVKLLKYDNIISQSNSLTCIEDLAGYILYFLADILDGKQIPPGIYNVVNPQPYEALEITTALQRHGLYNKNWNLIDLRELYQKTAAKRSNCVLSDYKITQLDLQLPPTRLSLDKCIQKMASTNVSENNRKIPQTVTI